MLDQPTLLVVLALLQGLLAVVALSLRVGLGDSARGLGTWAASLACVAVAAVLLASGFAQTQAAILLQNAFWVPSMVLTAIAVRRFLGFPGRERVFAAIALSTYGLAAGATVIAGWAELRLVLLASLHVACLVAGLHALLRAHPRMAGLGPLLMGVGLAMLALVQSWRAATVLLEGADAARFLVGGLVVPVLLVSTMLALTCITVAFLLLATDRVRRDLHALASRDPLSGLLNRRGFHERADALLALVARRDAPVAVAVIDLDDFRRLNDLGGHALGDRAIALVGSTLAAASRAEDAVARFGGEEFVVLMPMTDPEGALRTVDRLRSAIASALATSAPDGVVVTASAGLAVARGATTFDALYRRADEALYRAKAAGKDRAVLA
jgi:diguanylate cyclase (GGDEF)-like protein